MYISYENLLNKFETILLGRGVDPVIAHAAAENFAQTSLDGVYSHGVNRFPRVISYIDKGVVDGKAKPECVASVGGFERWDGHMGLGNANAKLAMDRACALAHAHGIGVVAIGNTNHWMRGGAYGWQAADNGCVGICWTNTMPNTPAWGGIEPKIGNNPFIISIPQSGGRHIVIDCAMSQFAFGKIEMARMKGEKLPVPGGFDSDGNPTTDPAEIEKTGARPRRNRKDRPGADHRLLEGQRAFHRAGFGRCGAFRRQHCHGYRPEIHRRSRAFAGNDCHRPEPYAGRGAHGRNH